VALPAIALAAYFVRLNVNVDYEIGTPPTLSATIDGPAAYVVPGDVPISPPPGTECDFAIDPGTGEVSVTFKGFFVEEICFADITISSDTQLTELQVNGGTNPPAIQIYLTDGTNDYWPEGTTFDMEGSGPYTWGGSIAASVTWDAVAGQAENLTNGDFTIGGAVPGR
jgi:hypothetical protein